VKIRAIHPYDLFAVMSDGICTSETSGVGQMVVSRESLYGIEGEGDLVSEIISINGNLYWSTTLVKPTASGQKAVDDFKPKANAVL
jgi:hypothetical protein